MHSYVFTGLLLIFGGGFGLHRFYTGYAGIGLLYLLTGGLFGFGILYDYIKFVSGEYEDAQGETLDGYEPAIGWCFLIIPAIIGLTIFLMRFSNTLKIYS